MEYLVFRFVCLLAYIVITVFYVEKMRKCLINVPFLTKSIENVYFTIKLEWCKRLQIVSCFLGMLLLLFA